MSLEPTSFKVESDLSDHIADSTDPHGSTLTQSVAVETPTMQNSSGAIAIQAMGDVTLNAQVNGATSTVFVKNNGTAGNANLNVENNIIVSGTVDGRDVAADGAILDVAILTTDFNAKGDILTAEDDDTPVILPVGSNGQIVVADSAQAKGIKWADVIKSFPVNWPNPVTSPTPDEFIIAVFDEAVTVNHVRQHVVTGTGTVDYQIYVRDWNSSDTGTTSLKTSGDFQATTTGTTETGLASSGAVAAGKVLVLKAVSQTGSPTLVRLMIKYTVD